MVDGRSDVENNAKEEFWAFPKKGSSGYISGILEGSSSSSSIKLQPTEAAAVVAAAAVAASSHLL